MEQRSFKDKRSPSKNSGNQKPRFKPPLFINDENEPTSPSRQQQAQSHDNPTGGKVRERPRSRKSESSITGNDILQDEIPKGIAKSLPEPVQIHGQGISIDRFNFLEFNIRSIFYKIYEILVLLL